MGEFPRPTVAILTDFGYEDAYVAIMKGVMIAYSPHIRTVDVTHLVPPQSVLAAAAVLHSALPYFPMGTVFLCVVDPGVGSARRELIATANGRHIVAPDNGLVSMVARMVPSVACSRASGPVLSEIARARPPHSHTFDGRDLFAPLAARIAARGVGAVTGAPVEPVLLSDVWPELQNALVAEGSAPSEPVLCGTVMHVDHFGNCITTIHVSDLGERYEPVDAVLPRSQERIASLSTTFSDVDPGTPLAYWGSSGLLEIAVNQASAADALSVRIGTAVELRLRELPPRPSEPPAG
jgi:S-adenosyl-L-methionine hydrolase (adenosine-forming)